MGIIQRQSIQGTIFTYLGIAIGFITSALIFPKILTTEQIGLLSIFVAYSTIFAQIASLGTGRMMIIAFPYFQSKKDHHHGLLFIIIIVSLIGYILSLIAYFILKPYLLENAHDSSKLLAQFIDYLIPLNFVTLLFIVLDSYYKVLSNAIKGIVLKEFVQRLLFLIFIIFLFYNLINFSQYVFFYILSIAIPSLILVISLIKDKEFNLKPDFGFITKDLSKLMISYGFYGIIIGFTGMVILNIDRIMVERLIGLGATGIYTTTAYFAALIMMPSRALLKISDPIIAQAWKKNDLGHLQHLYERSCLNQMIIGTLLFIGIWANEHNVFRILPPDFETGKYVIFFLGLAFLLDMASGVGGFILANSKYFKYQAFLLVLLIVLIVLSNLVFIPLLGLTGAAMATLLSKFLTNVMMYIFLWKKFGLQPYNMKYVWALLISGISYLAGYIIPEISNLILDIFIRSAVITVVFTFLILRFKISHEINERYEDIVQRFILPIFRKH